VIPARQQRVSIAGVALRPDRSVRRDCGPGLRGPRGNAELVARFPRVRSERGAER